MWAPIAWSYYLLDEGEKLLLPRLPVFVGECILEMIEGDCNFEGGIPLDVMDGVASLLDRSMLRQLPAGGGDVRFRMLATIGEYALERLEETDEGEALRHRHAEYFSHLAEEADKLWRGPRQSAEQFVRALTLTHKCVVVYNPARRLPL